jgi:3-hydroxymyristoyl/3-hydroxydecanoyl-(acyl carrier protein) dehydratase
MTPELEARVRAGRRGVLFDPDALPRLILDTASVERLLPHRDPMRLVDEVVGLDIGAGRIVGRRRIAADDPVFEGHFPDAPVYPGALQTEAVGQCGLCLHSLLAGGGAPPRTDARPPSVRLVRIVVAEFLEPVSPGADAVLLAELVDDGFTMLTLGQMVVDGRPTCVCAFEAMIFEPEVSDEGN